MISFSLCNISLPMPSHHSVKMKLLMIQQIFPTAMACPHLPITMPWCVLPPSSSNTASLPVRAGTA